MNPRWYMCTDGVERADIRIPFQIRRDEWDLIQRLRKEKDRDTTEKQMWQYIASHGVEVYVTSFESMPQESIA